MEALKKSGSDLGEFYPDPDQTRDKNRIRIRILPNSYLINSPLFFLFLYKSQHNTYCNTVLSMVLIQDGSSEHIAHVLCKQVFFDFLGGYADSFEVTKSLQQIEMPDLLHLCAHSEMSTHLIYYHFRHQILKELFRNIENRIRIPV